jgi:hypothetical protein
MTEETYRRFRSELNSFFVLVLLNTAFGALTMAFGMQFIVTSMLGLPAGQTGIVVRLLTGILSLVCFGTGFAWVLASARILRGVTSVRREYRKSTEPVSGEILTGWIVRLMAHYRKNRETIHWMTIICALGGCIFLALGILNLVQGFFALSLSGSVLIRILPFIAAAINLTIGLASLLFSTWFRKYSAVWDHRMEEASRSEDTLKKSLGIDRE